MPPGVVTEIGPFLAPLGTVAVICESLPTMKVAEAPPPNATLVAPVKPEPLIVTVEPTRPDVGEIDEIDGADAVVVTVKTPELAPAPLGVVTPIAPVVAPAGTAAVIDESLLTVNVVAGVPLNVTDVAPVKAEPLIATDVPTGPLTGAKDETAGGWVLVDEQPGSWNDAMRVCQSSWDRVVGCAS